MLYAVINEEPEQLSKIRPGTPPGLEQIVSQALAKDPADRYHSIDELLEDLKAVTAGTAPIRAKARPALRRLFGMRKAYFFSSLVLAAATLVILNIGTIRNFGNRT